MDYKQTEKQKIQMKRDSQWIENISNIIILKM